jgi:isopentenyldiphosphate isomerase
MTLDLMEQIKRYPSEYSLVSDPKQITNHFILWASRKLTHQLQLAHRSVQVMIFTKDHHLVLQKRNQQKATYPGYWDMSASGHVEAMDYLDDHADLNLDKDYQAVANKEVFEEIGVQTELRKNTAAGQCALRAF